MLFPSVGFNSCFRTVADGSHGSQSTFALYLFGFTLTLCFLCSVILIIERYVSLFYVWLCNAILMI